MARTPSTMVPLGTAAPHFSLLDTDGTTVSLDDYTGKPLLVIFTCNHCPFVIHIREPLSESVRRYQAQGLSVVGISSNDAATYPQDGPEAMKEAKEKYQLPYPYLFDPTQEVALTYHAACTPDFFLYDADHKLVYRGQYDGSRPGNDVAITGEDLDRAVADLFAGRVTEDQRPSMGCNIKWREENMKDHMPAYR